MLDSDQIAHAIDMQQRSYKLLQWMASAVKDGFISFATAHNYSNLPDATTGWIVGHYNNIPDDSRVPRESLPEFAAFFSTYLLNSFDLGDSSGKQLYSPGAHCFCPMCSWLIDAPNLKTKKLSAIDKRRADKMRVNAITQIAIDNSITLADSAALALLDCDQNKRDASLVAYGYDLLQRLNGIATGPAVLALWRSFAWEKTGSPKRYFKLKSVTIMDAKLSLLTKLENA